MIDIERYMKKENKRLQKKQSESRRSTKKKEKKNAARVSPVSSFYSFFLFYFVFVLISSVALTLFYTFAEKRHGVWGSGRRNRSISPPPNADVSIRGLSIRDEFSGAETSRSGTRRELITLMTTNRRKRRRRERFKCPSIFVRHFSKFFLVLRFQSVLVFYFSIFFFQYFSNFLFTVIWLIHFF